MDQSRPKGVAELVLLVASILGVAGGAVLYAIDGPADLAWAMTTLIGLVPAVWWLVGSIRRHELGVDVVAVLALIGALWVGEYLAGAIIALMLATGRVLESRAEARAGRDLSQLLDRAPRTAHREIDGALQTVPIDDVRVGDVLVIRPGDVVPVDGRLIDATATTDESALTGEPLPVTHAAGEPIPSGIVNAGGAFRITATTDAASSTYAGIVRLVSEAQASSAPFVRLANRYAAWFVPITLVIAGAAWLVSGDPVRAVAVLVVATPCPLLLAAPIAIVAGLSRAARLGVVVKDGSALERLGTCTTMLLDKTGTLTRGQPVVYRIEADDPDEVLRLAASLDQVSPHVLANAIVEETRARRLELSMPRDAAETYGLGIRGIVDGHEVAVGRAAWVADTVPVWAERVRRRAAREDAISICVGIDGDLRGVVLLADPMRPDAGRTVRRLRDAGLRRLVLVTGDRAEVAEAVGSALGIDSVLAERTPADKVDAVRLENQAAPTVMVGDGINDAPALAAATVGVAMGARGASASSEAADVVVTVDRLERLADAIVAARRSRSIALQSVIVGMALSGIGMIVAAVGWLPPTAGAILQEVIDVVVILNALRALTPGRRTGLRVDASEAELTAAYLHEHGDLRRGLDLIRRAADELRELELPDAVALAHEAHAFLVDELLPHEDAEEHDVYPAIARALGHGDSMAPMVRTHVEIRHFTRRLGRILEDLDVDPEPVDIADAQRLLTGLYAVLTLHFAQEEERYLTLA